MKRQPESSLIQLWLATAHLTAAIIASAVATTHALAVIYHLNRVREPLDHIADGGQMVDLSFADAMRDMARRKPDTD